MALTGRFTFRRSFMGRIVLQIEEEVRTFWLFSRKSAFRKRWRDATLMDLAAPELRALIDLRHKPQFMAQFQHLAPEPAAARAVEAEDGESSDQDPYAATPPTRPHLVGSTTPSGRGAATDEPRPDPTVELERREGWPRKQR